MHRWRVRVRRPVQPGVRHGDDGAEHGAVQRRADLRRVLRAAVRRRRRPRLVRAIVIRRGDGHQPVPAQLRAPERRRRVVQPAAAALRPVAAGVPPHRPLPRGRRARRLPQGAVPEAGRHPVHRQRPRLLQPGSGRQRGRRRRRARARRRGGRRPAAEDAVAGHGAELGTELAERRAPRPRPAALLQGHHQRPPLRRVLQRRARRVGLRPDIHRRPVPVDRQVQFWHARACTGCGFTECLNRSINDIYHPFCMFAYI